LRAALLRLLEATHGKFQCPSLVVSLVRLAGVAAPASSPDVGHGPSASGTALFSTPMFGGGGGYGSGALASVGSEELDALRCLLGAGLAVEDVLTLPVRAGLLRPDFAAMQSSLLRLVNRTASRSLFDAESTLELSRELSTTFITKLLGPRVGDGVAAMDAHTVVGHQVGKALDRCAGSLGWSCLVVVFSACAVVMCRWLSTCVGEACLLVRRPTTCVLSLCGRIGGVAPTSALLSSKPWPMLTVYCTGNGAHVLRWGTVCIDPFMCGEMCGRTSGGEVQRPFAKRCHTLRLAGVRRSCCGQVVFRVAALRTPLMQKLVWQHIVLQFYTGAGYLPVCASNSCHFLL
jgi:hypothetical protein